MRELLVAGAGIAGLNAANAAVRRGSTHVTLVEAHTYQTLPPQLARGAAGLAAFGQMALMLPESDRWITRVRANIDRIDPAGRTITAGGRQYTADKLIVAVGEGQPRGPAVAEGVVYSPYTAEAAARLRVAWHAALAAAAHRRPLPGEPVRLVIVGGGAFGCELALAFATMRPIACQRYGLPQSMIEIVLCEAAARLLPEWPARAAEIIGRELYLSEVETRLGSPAIARTAGGVRLEGGEELAADIVVWAAGRETSPLLAGPEWPRDNSGRLLTDEFLRVAGYGDVFAIGDCSSLGRGWDWALASARAAAANATSRLPRESPQLGRVRRWLHLPLGRAMALDCTRMRVNALPIVDQYRLLLQRYAAGGVSLVLQAWPSPTPDHSLAAWRDATERRRGRHAERRF